MTRHILSVSVSEEEKQIIDSLKLSPSELIQSKIADFKVLSEESSKVLKDANRKIEFLQQTIAKQRDFIEAKGLMDEFIGL